MVHYRDGKDDGVKWTTKLGTEAQQLVTYHRSENKDYNIQALMDDMTGKEIRQVVEELAQEEFRLRYMLTAIHRTQKQIADRFERTEEIKLPWDSPTLENPRDLEISEDLEDEDDE